MTQRRYLYDQHGGVIREVHYRDPTDIWSMEGVKVEYDLTATNRAVEEIKSQSIDRKSPYRHARKIPVHVLERAMREGWMQDKKKWIEWANSPEGMAFATHAGRI
jgi:hypothetical protein